MSDLPELSESTKRRLKIQWDTLRDKHRLTEEHVAKHDHNRNQLLATTPSRRTPNWPRAKQAACNFGLDPSVRVAEVRFREIDHEYWTKWCSRGMTYEIYASWLEIIKREVCAEVESIWKGRSNLTDCWFQTTCAPAIGKALARLVKLRIAQARDVEVQRLARDPSAAGSATGNPMSARVSGGGGDRIAAAQRGPKSAGLGPEQVVPPDPAVAEAGTQVPMGVPSSLPVPHAQGAISQEVGPTSRSFASGDSGNAPVPAEQHGHVELAAARQAVVNPILKSKRWTRGRWVTKAGVSKNSVYEYLEGKRNLSQENREAMAQALGLPPEQLPD